MKTKRLLQTVALGGALVSATASAQMEIPRGQYWDHKSDDAFRTVLAFPMLWAPEINVKAETGGEDIEATIPFADILTHLNVGLMGELYLNWRWLGFIAKGMYMDVTTDEYSLDTGVLNDVVNVNLDADVTLKMGMYDFGLSWRLWRNLRLFTLGRLTQVDVSIRADGNVSSNGLGNCSNPSSTLCVVPPFDNAVEKKVDVTPDDMWDYLLGLQYAWWFGNTKRHGINLYGDAAVSGDSDEAWQVDVRYMYRVSEMNNFWLGWRTYQSVSGDDGGEQTTVTLNGPLAGWAFSF